MTRPGLQTYFGGATLFGVRAKDQKAVIYAPWCGVKTLLRPATIASFRRSRQPATTGGDPAAMEGGSAASLAGL